MKLPRILLGLATLLLLATAAFHGSGGAMVGGWLEGDRAAILRLLWYTPAIDWIVVALIWGFVAWRAERAFAPFVYISAIAPLAIALMLITAIGAAFPGIWMLIGAAALALLGAARLPENRLG